MKYNVGDKMKDELGDVCMTRGRGSTRRITRKKERTTWETFAKVGVSN